MTGFASLTRDEDLATISVTIRSVNHRFLDVQLRAPAALAAAESRLRGLVQQRIARGRIEVSVSLQSRADSGVDVEVNDAVVEAVAAAMDRARERGLDYWFPHGGGPAPRAPGDLHPRTSEGPDR